MSTKSIQAEENNLILQLFDHPELNEVGAKLIELDDEYARHIKEAKSSIYSAFRTRWLYGKIISENMDLIEEECGTQKNFAKQIGKSPAVVSNNKRGYEYLLDEGCETWEQVVETLEDKNISLNVRNFEKIGTLLNEPNEQTDKKTQIDKDRKRLEELRGEAEEILRRLEPQGNPELYEDAFEFKEDIEDIQTYVDSFDPAKTGWTSEKYLNFVRNFGHDIITGEQLERCDPHHTDKQGGSGPTGAKLPDYYTIPVSRDTHNAIESGLIELSPEEILEAQFITLTSFLTLNMK